MISQIGSKQKLKLGKKKLSHPMNVRDVEQDEGAIDISDIGVQIVDYVCPYCSIIMLPVHQSQSDEAVSLEVQCASCGYKLDLDTADQAKHASKLTPKITEEMIADGDEDDTIFETADEDPSRTTNDDEETNDFAEDDRRDDESLRRKGYRIVSSS
jgi:DNA-directed RNA polymerase subunit M/transcription elongation factor TFIIS